VRHRTLHAELGASGAISLPVLEVGSAGPLVVITGNIHGDEATGVVACHRLAAALHGNMGHGRVVMLPSLNPAGLAQMVRVVPMDGADLNRVFPGSVTGTATQRLAARIWQELVRLSPAAVIDLHADSALSIPYVIADRPVDLPVDERIGLEARVLEMAVATGITVVHEYPDDEYRRYALDRSLAGAVVNRLRRPAVTIEAGGRRLIDAAAVDTMVYAVAGVLAWLGVATVPRGSPPARVAGGPWRRANAIRSREAGVLVPLVSPGARFEAGEVIGEVRTVAGEVRERLTARESGMVIAWADTAWVAAGGGVATIAVAEHSGRSGAGG
jgi:predicted deacylase